VLVEIKRPDTPIFRARQDGGGRRAGTRAFNVEFTGAVSQVLEQKAEWLAFSGNGEHFTRDGSRRLKARTRNAKTISVIGSRAEFEAAVGPRNAQVLRDTFELFRRETRSIDIVTVDELFERARSSRKTTGSPSPVELYGEQEPMIDSPRAPKKRHLPRPELRGADDCRCGASEFGGQS
jgi:hypothetical protein